MIELLYPKGEGARPAYPVMATLRMHLMQNGFGYSDPTMEEALYETTIRRQFLGLSRLMRVKANKTLRSLEATAKSPPPSLKAAYWLAMATIAIRQAARLSATAKQQNLLTLRHQLKGIGTGREAVRKLGRVPAAAQQQGIARFDLAYLG